MSALPLATRNWGSGDRTALLIHGITSDGGTWWRLGPALAAEGYTVSAVDLRGHGDSPRAAIYGLADYVDDVTALGTAPWDLVVGPSLGGAIALSAAAARPR
jgi:pimeloyl-ACP methyl ester carboxylesterase